jgi:RNA polymerase sigma-70 factor (family 1)
MQTDEDKILVEALIKGDASAFRQLYDKYHGALYRYAGRFLKSDEDAKEIVHDVYLKIWEKRETLNSDLSFKYFLLKVCKNTVVNLMVKAARERTYKKELSYADRVENDTENVVIYSEFERFANAAIAHLPTQRQAIYKMCKLEGKSYEEAAENFGITKGTVRDHLLKAARSIKKMLALYSLH